MPINTDHITICAASREELPIIAGLAERIWPQAYSELLGEGQIRYMLKMMYDLPVLQKEYAHETSFDLIFDGGEPIGFASYGPCKEHSHTCAKLHKLYLDQVYHNRGIGTLALRHIVGETRAKGYKVLHLNVNKNNESAIRAYKRNGFHIAREEVNDIGNGFVMDDFVREIEL